MPGFRYHIATLAAVFLALGVGIIIGSSFVQSAIVAGLTRRLDDLKAQFARDIVAEREKTNQYKKLVGALTPRVAATRVAIIQTGDYDEPTRGIRDTLEQAGATVSSITRIDRSFPTRSQTNLGKVLPALRATHPALPAEPSSLLQVLAIAVARGAPDTDVAALADANLLTRDGDYSRPNDVAVLVGGATLDNDSRADAVDVPLIRTLRAQGLHVVVAEPENAEISYIPALRWEDVVTVDNADTDVGRLALALALRATPGNYGVKPTARSGIIPPCALTDDNRRRAGVE